MQQLVLSLFPGIGLLDMAFEAEGFCVVRGPDLLWGGDIRNFHPPAGKFDGVIGGPPCQSFSPIGNVNKARWGENSIMPDTIPEFRRVILEVGPSWWLMENSVRAYAPFNDCHELTLDSAWLGERQARRRRFWSNLRLEVEMPLLVPATSGTERAVSSCGSVDWKGSRARERARTLEDMLELQGFPRDFLAHCPFTKRKAMRAVGNGVPLPMGLAIAKAVKASLRNEKGNDNG